MANFPLLVGFEIHDQTLPFMFEVMDSAAPNRLPFQYILPLAPESYRKGETTRATVTQTAGGAFEDNIGMGLPKISIQGTFGFLGTYEGGGGQSLSGVNKDGWGLFKEIEGILLSFYQRFGTNSDSGAPTTNPVNPDNPPELRFYNFTDEDYYVIQLNKFEVTRNIQRRFLYQYTIEITALRHLLHPSWVASDALDRLLNQVPDPPSLSLWQTMLQGYSSVYGGMSDMINTVNGIEQNINMVAGAVNAFKQGITDRINCPIGLLQTITSAVDSVLGSTQNATGIPFEFTNDLRQTKRSMLLLGFRRDLFGGTSATASAAVTTNLPDATEIMTAPLPQNAAALGVVEMSIPEVTLFDPSLETSAEVASSETSINQDDTLSTIAQKTLGDATAWTRIALLNDLEYPFIVQKPADAFTPALATSSLSAPAAAGSLTIMVDAIQPAPGATLLVNDGTDWEAVIVQSTNSIIISIQSPLQNSYAQGTPVTQHDRALSVLMPGQKMQIPGGASTGAAIVAGGSQDDFYTAIFGTDEYLYDDGAHEADPGGDIMTVSGLDNLAMALGHRLRTLRGELAALGHPDYGSYLPLIVGKIGIPMWYQRAVLEAKVTMLADPRVSSVGAVSLTAADTAILLEADVYPVNQTAATKMSIVVG